MALTSFHREMVMGTSFLLPSTTSAAKWSAENLPPTMFPKMLLIAAVDGSGTLKMQKCLFSLFGMSFFPPPGWFIAPKK